ncbi:MAG: hypothetical protein KAR20_00510 [Candidatus Heimdallarchaeota archaeon]|nr:hypothetical protein [Candidatus Heimdallarchaeota archaeon]
MRIKPNDLLFKFLFDRDKSREIAFIEFKNLKKDDEFIHGMPRNGTTKTVLRKLNYNQYLNTDTKARIIQDDVNFRVVKLGKS